MNDGQVDDDEDDRGRAGDGTGLERNGAAASHPPALAGRARMSPRPEIGGTGAGGQRLTPGSITGDS